MFVNSGMSVCHEMSGNVMLGQVKVYFWLVQVRSCYFRLDQVSSG